MVSGFSSLPMAGSNDMIAAEQWVPINALGRGLEHGSVVLRAAFADVLASGWLVHGPQHQAFEKELAAYVGARDAIGVATGTDALELALRALMPEGRNVVITTANCGGYTTTAALRAGFAVRYVDVEPETALMDVADLQAKLTPETGVVVLTHLFGRAADVDEVIGVCGPLGVKVLEDCAQALGARTPQGQRVGGVGDAAAFSFYPTKNLGALGDGGAVATSDSGVAEKVRQLRQYGWTSKYTITVPGGRNSRLDELQAAFLRARLPQLDGWNQRRREVLASYADTASDKVRVLISAGETHVGHLAVVVVDDRDTLKAHLERNLIKTDIHYPVPDHRQPAFAAFASAANLPVTEYLAQHILTLPLFPELTDHEVERVCNALASYR